jgi:acid phosphatase type 7
MLSVTGSRSQRNGFMHYFITAPTPLNEKPVRIWAIGDFGTGDSIPRAVAKAYLNYRTGWHTDVWLMLGDIAYMRGTDEQFQEAVFRTCMMNFEEYRDLAYARQS